MFGLDCTIEIDEDQVVTCDAGDPASEPSPRQLTTSEAEEVKVLAQRVVELGDQEEDEPAGVDGGVTKLDILDGTQTTKVTVSTGSSTSDDVWQLLDAIDRIS